ncbi:MAG TPA: Ig-like domain-containing protein, partial [Kofleriaceae bacterium]|nr:Ig-like domain-containing protein [Kofleriaceae bacterium]
VPRGTAELRVALNSTDGTEANLDLHLKAGEPASPSFADCSAAGEGAHGYCQVDSPEPGTWHVQVIAPGSEGVGGDFQMTATAVGGAPVGVDDLYGVGSDDTLEVDAAGGVLANDEATARGALEATVDEPPAHGQVELAADGSFRYVPESGYVGEDSFTYLASDGSYQGPARVVLMVGTGGEGNSVLGGCRAGGGGGWAGAALVVLLLAAALRISQACCRSRRG